MTVLKISKLQGFVLKTMQAWLDGKSCFLIQMLLRPVLHEGGGPQVGEVTCGGLPHLTCKCDCIKMRDCMDRRVTPPKRVTSPTWGPPPPCKQALTFGGRCNHYFWDIRLNIHRSPNFRGQSLTIGGRGGGGVEGEGWYYFKSAGPKISAPLRLTAQKSCPLQKCVPTKL